MLTENKSSGYVKLHRSITDSWIWDKEKKTKFEAWVYILLKANWQDAKVNIGFTLIDIKRGEFFTSQDQLSKALRWDRSAVRKFLYLLQKDNMVVTVSTPKYTKITICNYDSYQDIQPAKQHQHNINATSTQHQVPTTKKNKEEYKKNKEEDDSLKIERFEISLKLDLPAFTLELAEYNQFSQTKNKNTQFIKNNWKIFLGERLSDTQGKLMQYRELSDLTNYFLNWVRNKFPKNYEDNITPSSALPGVLKNLNTQQR